MEPLGKKRECSTATQTTASPPLYTVKPLPQTAFNRVFAAVYSCAILALFYHHSKTLVHSSTLVTFSVTLILFIADIVLAFMWSAVQAMRMCPIYRKEFPENLERVMTKKDFPALDVFICTADPFKEPPMSVVNTALSVLAYDYPPEKLSVYVSDDGGSALTLFAFMETAKFAGHWLPFCRNNNVLERSPDAYFESNYPSSPEAEKIKRTYEEMKARVEHVVKTGKMGNEHGATDKERETLNKWTDNFTRQNHPTVIQVLLESGTNKDIAGQVMPNLIYFSREKSKTSHHYFKAGALNALLRISAVMTNAPIILILDCDMYSKDPQTPLRILCYYSDPEIRSRYAFIQLPQRFKWINKNDIYAGEFKRLFQINPMGFDGLRGANHVGTCCFFFRRAFFGGPSTLISPEVPELGPDYVVKRPIQSHENVTLAHQVAACNYENQTSWGSKIGYKYGSFVEDFYTGFRLHCEGWRSIFCNPGRPAYLGDAPMRLIDLLIQQKRWAVGVLQVGFSRYSPLIFGFRAVGPLTAMAYSHYAFWPILCIPITLYAFLPQLALLNGVRILPKVSEPWFLLYGFLFLGAYGQDFLDFALAGATFQKWWSDQRIWNIRGLSCLLLGSAELFLSSLGISTQGFNVTNKVVDDEQGERYNQGIFEFGVHSSMFVPLVMAALINFTALISGLVEAFKRGNLEGLLFQIIIAGYGVVNSWPIYEAIFLRKDKGKMPTKTTIIAAFLAWALYVASCFCLR